MLFYRSRCMVKHKKDGRSVSRQTLEQYRLRAIKLRKKGWKVQDIAEFFGVHRGSVSNWFTRKKYGGIKALKMRKAPGAMPKLDKKQFQQVLKWLKFPATSFGFETDLWDCRRVRLLIKEKLRIKMDNSNVWRLLRRLNLTLQKPEKRAVQQNKQAVDQWLKEEWPRIKAQAKRWQALIYFLDEAGVSLIPNVGRTWAPKGKTPIIRVTGAKGGVCVTSAISPSGKMVFRIEKSTICAPEHIDFLEQILKNHPRRKIIVLEDRARPHVAKAVREFVEKHKRRLAIYFIPSYSPELNPDEHTWRHLKKHELRAHLAKTTDDLRTVVLSKMRSMQRRPTIVRSFFNDTYII
jgi:transposase